MYYHHKMVGFIKEVVIHKFDASPNLAMITAFLQLSAACPSPTPPLSNDVCPYNNWPVCDDDVATGAELFYSPATGICE